MIVHKRSSVCPRDCPGTCGLLVGVEGGPPTLMIHRDGAIERVIAEDMDSIAGSEQRDALLKFN